MKLTPRRKSATTYLFPPLTPRLPSRPVVLVPRTSRSCPREQLSKNSDDNGPPSLKLFLPNPSTILLILPRKNTLPAEETTHGPSRRCNASYAADGPVMKPPTSPMVPAAWLGASLLSRSNKISHLQPLVSVSNRLNKQLWLACPLLKLTATPPSLPRGSPPLRLTQHPPYTS